VVLVSRRRQRPGGLDRHDWSGRHDAKPGDFSITIKYTLVGGTSGSGTADLVEQFAINNLTQNATSFHFFQYSDFQPGGSLNNTIQFGQDLRGGYNEALASSSSGSVSIDTGAASSANHSEAAAVPVTLNKLNDGVATTLSDTTDPGPGNITWALEWDDAALAAAGQPGSSLTFSTTTDVTSQSVQEVPDATGQWAACMGLAACVVMRRYFRPRTA